jgi:hypothetical protein
MFLFGTIGWLNRTACELGESNGEEEELHRLSDGAELGVCGKQSQEETNHRVNFKNKPYTRLRCKNIAWDMDLLRYGNISMWIQWIGQTYYIENRNAVRGMIEYVASVVWP